MAVKRVILQHFSMKYDYMTKERPNIYQPSRANQPDDSNYERDIIKLHKDSTKAKAAANKAAALANNTSNESVDSGFAYKDTNDLFEEDDHHSSTPYPKYDQNGSQHDNDDEFEPLDDWHSVSDVKPRRARRTDDSANLSEDDDENNPSEQSPECAHGNSHGVLDSIIELKEKLPDTYSCTTMYKNAEDENVPNGANHANQEKGEQQQDTKMGRPKFDPTPAFFKVPLRATAENWRYRKNEDKKQYANNTTNCRSIIQHQQRPVNGNNFSLSRSTYNPTNQQQVNGRFTTDAPIARSEMNSRNWRNECMNNVLSRNCGMSATRAVSSASVIRPGGSGSQRVAGGNSAGPDEYLGFGLSPPSESLMMQRRQRVNSRLSADLGRNDAPIVHTSPVPTASG